MKNWGRRARRGWGLGLLLLFWGFSFSVYGDDDIARSPQSLAERIVVVPDVHGDLGALNRILTELGLISARTGRWTGGETVLIFLGDLVNLGPDSLPVMSLVMRLKEEAMAQGGRVHQLFGNHEEMLTAGFYHYFNKAEHARLVGRLGRTAMHQIFRSEGSPFAELIAHSPLVIQYGPFLFTHAGLDPNLAPMSLSDINELTRDMIVEMQNTPVDDLVLPIAGTEGVRRSIWTRPGLVEGEGYPLQSVVDVLKARGAKVMVVGHDIVDRVKVLTLSDQKHLVLADTGMSRGFEESGRISALEIVNGQIQVHEFKKPLDSQSLSRVRKACTQMIRRAFLSR